MMLIKVTHRSTDTLMKKAEFNRMLKQAWLILGLYWHRELRPKHFTHAGAREYGYLPRSGERGTAIRKFNRSYTGRKLRKFGHTLPLVYTGRSRAQSATKNIKSTSKGCRVVLNTPTLNFIPKGGRINLRDEVTRISLYEHQLLVQRLDQAIGVAIAEDERRRESNTENFGRS